MMNALKLRAESYNEWSLNVNEALEAKINKKKSMSCFYLNVIFTSKADLDFVVPAFSYRQNR